MSSQASNFKRRPSSRSAPRPSTTSSTGTVAKAESTAATSAVITFTKKMGPGVPWVPWITGLQEACRAANYHVVANAIQSLEQPLFGKQGLENLQTQINKLQSEQKTVLGRITRLEKEPPWSEAVIQKTYKEHIVVFNSQFDPFWSDGIIPDITAVEDLKSLLQEYHLYFREPSSAQEDVWNQILKLLDVHDVFYEANFAEYRPHEITRWYLKVIPLRIKEVEMSARVDTLKSSFTALLSNSSKESTQYIKDCAAVINFIYTGSNFSDAGFRDKMKADPTVKAFITSANIIQFLLYIKTYYDATSTEVQLYEKLITWQTMVPKRLEKFNSFYERWKLERLAVEQSGCALPSNAVQVAYLSTKILPIFYNDPITKLYLSQFRLPKEDPNFRKASASPEDLCNNLMSIIRSTTTSKQVADISYTVPSASAAAAAPSTVGNAGKANSKDTVVVDHVAVLSSSTIPSKNGNKKNNGITQSGKPADQKAGSSPSTGNQLFTCPVCFNNHPVIRCAILRSCPAAQKYYELMIAECKKAKSSATKSTFKNHAATIKSLSASLENDADSDHDSIDDLSYFVAALSIAKLSAGTLHQVMLDSGATTFLFNDASIFSSLDLTPTPLKPFKDSEPIIVDGQGFVPGLGNAYYDANCYNICSFASLEQSGWSIDAIKCANITTSFAVRSPDASSSIEFHLSGASYWCDATVFFAHLSAANHSSAEIRPASLTVSTLSTVLPSSLPYNLRSAFYF